MADERKPKRKMPTFRETMRIGVNKRGEDIFLNKEIRDKVLAHEKAERKKKKKVRQKGKKLGAKVLRDS